MTRLYWPHRTDHFDDPRRLECASAPALVLEAALRCKAKELESDGALTLTQIRRAAGGIAAIPDLDAALGVLLECGLITQLGEGTYELPDWQEWMRSKAELDELRSKRADAGRKGGKQRAKQLASTSASNEVSALPKRDVPRVKSKSESESQEDISSSSGDSPASRRDAVIALLVDDRIRDRGDSQAIGNPRYRAATRASVLELFDKSLERELTADATATAESIAERLRRGPAPTRAEGARIPAPPSDPCRHCANGWVDDENGDARRCARCNGTGVRS